MNKNKVSKIMAVVLVCALALCALAGCNAELDQAKSDFKAAAAALDERNAALDAKVDALNELINGGEQPLDAKTVEAANKAVGDAQAAKKVAPEVGKDVDEVREQIAELEACTYGAENAELDSAKKGLEDSIAQMRLVTNPADADVIKRLQGVPNIVNIAAVTEGNDPNGKLNKQGGYTATVYFESDLVDQSKVSGTDVISRGTDGGGAVEVYRTAEEAQKRNDYLAAFDGSIFASGSHVVCGTCLVRTSDNLTASQQSEMTANVIAALTKLG